MTAGVRLQAPFIDGSRKIYPVVAETSMQGDYGIVGSLLPLALIIEENGDLSCALIEGDCIISILEKLACPAL